MTGYAYFVQTCREEHKRKHPDEQVIFAEFSKKCAKRWKEMNDKEKKTFNDMTEMDRIRYEREMKEYVSRGGKPTKRTKKKKDPNAPKRPQSAFFLFCADHRGPLRQTNPSLSVGDIAKQLGKKWAECSTETRKKYSDQSDIEKAKYVKEIEKYRASQQAMGLAEHSPNKRQRMDHQVPVAPPPVQQHQQPASSSDDEESESEAPCMIKEELFQEAADSCIEIKEEVAVKSEIKEEVAVKSEIKEEVAVKSEVSHEIKREDVTC